MIIEDVKQFKDSCKTILAAIDTSAGEQSLIAETLELVGRENCLKMMVTNREYMVTVTFQLEQSENFKATVNALLFLKLVAQLTVDSLELEVVDTSLVVRAGGIYRLPLIYNDQVLLELPQIRLENITSSFDILSSTLSSILQYNSKEIQSARSLSKLKPIQKLYYVDDKGAITFTTGACVNNFTLPQSIKLLLSGKVVKLFRLFAESVPVHFEISQDVDSQSNFVTKVRFSTDTIEIAAITPSDLQLLRSVPVDAIRSMAAKTYDYSVVLDKNELQRILSRLLLFKNADLTVRARFSFAQSGCSICYCDNQEWIGYNDEQFEDFHYSMYLNIETFKTIVEGCVEDYLTLNFGDHRAVVLVRQNIKNIIPELIS